MTYFILDEQTRDLLFEKLGKETIEKINKRANELIKDDITLIASACVMMTMITSCEKDFLSEGDSGKIDYDGAVTIVGSILYNLINTYADKD